MGETAPEQGNAGHPAALGASQALYADDLIDDRALTSETRTSSASAIVVDIGCPALRVRARPGHGGSLRLVGLREVEPGKSPPYQVCA
jgi:hypothetical protein